MLIILLFHKINNVYSTCRYLLEHLPTRRRAHNSLKDISKFLYFTDHEVVDVSNLDSFDAIFSFIEHCSHSGVGVSGIIEKCQSLLAGIKWFHQGRPNPTQDRLQQLKSSKTSLRAKKYISNKLQSPLECRLVNPFTYIYSESGNSFVSMHEQSLVGC